MTMIYTRIKAQCVGTYSLLSALKWVKLN